MNGFRNPSPVHPTLSEEDVQAIVGPKHEAIRPQGPQDYRVKPDDLSCEVRCGRNVVKTWEATKNSPHPLAKEGFRFIFHTPKYRHGAHTTPIDTSRSLTHRSLLVDCGLWEQRKFLSFSQQGRPFTHAYEIYLERARLLFDSGIGKLGAGIPVTVQTNEDRVLHPKLGSGDAVDGFVAAIQEVLRCVRNNTPFALSDGQLARDAVVLGHRQTMSLGRCRWAKGAR